MSTLISGALASLSTAEGRPPMRTYTTCVSCGGPLEVAGSYRRSHHPDCPLNADYITDLELRLHTAIINGNTTDADRLADAIDAYERRPPQMLAAALAYATWGWPVFRCWPGRKTPMAQHWRDDATTDPATITSWWTAAPAANIGLPTGGIFDVVDVDPAGLSSWIDVQRRAEGAGHTLGADLPDIHGQVSTPRGGLHLYVPASGDGNLAGFLPGVDYRGVGGYVVAPPSVLDPAALKAPVPAWPLRYAWWTRPSPAITGQPVRA